ncbi:Lrp/AsnC ligand binding domain-containing protein [Candidatus Woesearchaeota archaeon]|nr:MAG: transcriptional regulator [archaeon GW2011_AR4]MBS3130533.1 Lrp/AsnC ligand binding domain-containing protein [Candidatus Woesearchaeota archaeon]HIH38013.1 Lrp/AsnC family transcriptional regulator [Candidatus Woesearchaeota archaeon]HIH48682.1 Lrp/AsnC family transcriptional regulator [Candidatus Woesearchaeota archaeon]HIJ02982.1 Lrp/AsnC family transcriptional regulator [Candidatus Woesearchaeota archaeon]
MVHAFILISVRSGIEKNVVSKIKDIHGVLAVHEIFGEWDIISEVDVDSITALDRFVSERLRIIEGVRMTSTLIVKK